MGIGNLRRDLITLQDGQPLPAVTYGQITNGALAVVYVDGSIVISESLDMKERIEAEAHELMHIMLNRQGLLAVGCENEGDCEFLALEINNALSHLTLIDNLKNNYNISSQLHLKERVASLNTIQGEIEQFYQQNRPALLKALGLRLYDIVRTVPEKESIILDIISTNKSVNHTFHIARQLFNEITIETTEVIQREIIRTFLISVYERGEEFYISQL